MFIGRAKLVIDDMNLQIFGQKKGFASFFAHPVNQLFKYIIEEKSGSQFLGDKNRLRKRHFGAIV